MNHVVWTGLLQSSFFFSVYVLRISGIFARKPMMFFLTLIKFFYLIVNCQIWEVTEWKILTFDVARQYEYMMFVECLKEKQMKILISIGWEIKLILRRKTYSLEFYWFSSHGSNNINLRGMDILPRNFISMFILFYITCI